MMRPRRAVCAIATGGALALGALSGGVSPALAGAPQLAIIVHQASGPPTSYLSVQAQPGQQVAAGTVTVENVSDQPASVQLAPVDATTTGTLGSAYQSPGSATHGATGWLVLSGTTMALAPHASADVAVTVAVPASAAPGDYLSGISILATGQASASATGSFAAGQQDRYAVGVEAQVAGARTAHLGFSGASVTMEPSSLVFYLLAHNDGNVILQGVSGHATVTQGSRLVATQTIAPGTFVTGTSIEMPVRAPTEHPTPGTVYRVQAELDYPGGVATLDTKVTFDPNTSTTPPRNGSGSGGAKPATPQAPSSGARGVTMPHRQAGGHRRRHPRHATAPKAAAPHGATTTHTPTRRTVHRHAPASSTSPLHTIAKALARAAAVVAKHSAFPIVLIIVMGAFLLVQDRIDRRDPKLALAPVYADPQLDFS